MTEFMHRLFNRKQIFTIPNLLSALRLAMVPLIVWLYWKAENYHGAVMVLLVSGLTDIVDGFIARKFDMVSDLGKVLDPTADKLTQFAVLLCLLIRYEWMRVLIGVFVINEICMIVMGWLAIKKKDLVNSAKWYGKMNTVILYSVTLLLILIPSIPLQAANIMIAVCTVSQLFCLFMYSRFYWQLFQLGRKEKTA